MVDIWIYYYPLLILFSLLNMHKWLSIIGIGEDGIAGLSKTAILLVNQAEILVGGERHLAMLPPDDGRKKISWNSPFGNSIQQVIQYRNQNKLVCVLSSGDPMCYGVGASLIKHIPKGEITIIPTNSAFSLACSRLGWNYSEVETISVCGRPVSLLASYIYPNAKLLILSEGKHTPAMVASILTTRGYGGSKITVLEKMGGVNERILTGLAQSWPDTEIADLNTMAVECIAQTGISGLSRLPGLPDDAFHHDGQLTKREVRSLTLSTLAPLPGELLWDIGSGCGSIAIEWMRTNIRCAAVAIEQNSMRSHYMADNANALGTPNLQIICGQAPQVLRDLPTPNAIFIGGGISTPGLLEECWNSLSPGGRIVANVVTLEGEKTLFRWYEQVGGSFTRISIQRAQPLGKFLGWKAMSPVTQWVTRKS